jgi:uncharacterized protein YdeI (YjbR/CyaY-like superfamily)
MPASVVAALADQPNTTLKRPIEAMPADVRRRLTARGLTAAYRERPAYQQNDYLRWLSRAKLPRTREKRLQQMLTELERGGVYMKMSWTGGAARSVKPSARAKRKAR